MAENGIILKGIGGFYYVLYKGETLECKAGGRLRLNRDIVPCAGDYVKLEFNSKEPLITEILPRKNSFIRPPIANVDRLFITASQAPPVTDRFLIDKMTVIALYQDVEPVILLTKSDMDSGEELKKTYESCGFKVIVTSSVTGEGRDEILKLVANCVAVFSGNSGVGKSSILNTVFSHSLNLEIGGLSEKIGRGKNTTRTTEIFMVDGGGFVADTPGFSSFELSQMPKINTESLMHLFPEMENFWNKCRFNGCTHRKEPDCAVKQALLEGHIQKSRYESYVKLYDELSMMRDW